jgi:hypothetical protein
VEDPLAWLQNFFSATIARHTNTSTGLQLRTAGTSADSSACYE